MNKVDLQLKSKERREKILESMEADSASYQETVRQKVREQAEARNSGQLVTAVNELFSKMSGTKDIGGIPHTPDDQANFKQMFTDAVSINPETGYSRTRELFNNDEVLYKALYLYNKVEVDGSLRNWLSGFKEDYKQDILDKTGIAPRQQKGSFQNVEIPGAETFV